MMVISTESYLEAWEISESTEVGTIRDVRKQGKGGGKDVFVNTSTLAWLYTNTRRN